MENSKHSTNRIIQIIGVLTLLTVGFFLGRNFSEPNNEMPQGVILNSGPGLENIQSVTDVFLKAWNDGDAEGCANTYSEQALFMPTELSSIQGRGY